MTASVTQEQWDAQVAFTAELQQTLIRADARVTALTAEIETLKTNTAVLRSELSTKSEYTKTLIDARGILKPSNFDSDLKKWKLWAFKLKKFVSGVFSNAEKLLDWAKLQEVRISLDKAEAEIAKTSGMTDFNNQLYTALAALTEGEALSITMNTDQRNGLELWRKLNRRFDPQTASRKTDAISTIIHRKSVPLASLSDEIEKWEELVRQHENSTGKSVDEYVKCSALIKICPAQLAEHIKLNLGQVTYEDGKTVSYEKLREHIDTYIRAKTDSDPGPVNMDVGSLGPGAMKVDQGQGASKGSKGGKGGKGNKGGKGFQYGSYNSYKGKGKGKQFNNQQWYMPPTPYGGGAGGKSKGKGGGKGYGKKGSTGNKGGKSWGKGPRVKFDGNCGFCHMYGHKRADCRKRMAHQGVNAIDSLWDQYPDYDEQGNAIWDTDAYTWTEGVDTSTSAPQEHTHDPTHTHGEQDGAKSIDQVDAATIEALGLLGIESIEIQGPLDLGKIFQDEWKVAEGRKKKKNKRVKKTPNTNASSSNSVNSIRIWTQEELNAHNREQMLSNSGVPIEESEKCELYCAETHVAAQVVRMDVGGDGATATSVRNRYSALSEDDSGGASCEYDQGHLSDIINMNIDYSCYTSNAHVNLSNCSFIGCQHDDRIIQWADELNEYDIGIVSIESQADPKPNNAKSQANPKLTEKSMSYIQTDHGDVGQVVRMDVADCHLVQGEWETLDITADSGAAISMLPEECCTDYPLIPTLESKLGIAYKAANSGKIHEKGMRVLFLKTEEGLFRKVPFKVGKVSKPLLAIKDQARQGNRTVLDDDGSYIQDKKTNEIIKLSEKCNTYFFRAKVVPYHLVKEIQSQKLAQLSTNSSQEKSSFPGHASKL